MLMYIIALFVLAGGCWADSLVTTTAGWNESGVNASYCIDGESGEGGAFSSCGGDVAQGEIITSFSNAGNYYLIPSFGGTVDAATDAMVDSFARVTATASYTEQLVVPGTGSGTLVLNFAMMGKGNDDLGNAEMVFSATGLTVPGGGGNGYCPEYGPETFACQTILPDGELIPYYSVSSSIPITLGVPFAFTEQLMLSASGNDGFAAFGYVTAYDQERGFPDGCDIPPTPGFGPIDCGYASVSLLNYSVLDANGNPIPGALLADGLGYVDPSSVPEPATWLCVLTALPLLAYHRVSQKL
jgi:hypothetical protein